MKIEVNIKKRDVIIFASLLVIVSLAIAQTSTSNPRHDSDQIWVKNVVGFTDQPLNAFLAYVGSNVLNSGAAITTIQNSYCRSDGTNCPTSAVAGSIVGGGSNRVSIPSGGTANCVSWGSATCSGAGVITCPSGSTARSTGENEEILPDSVGNPTQVFAPVFICVKN